MVSDLLQQYFSVLEEREAHAAKEKWLNQKKADLEKQLADYFESTGLSTIESDLIRVTYTEELRARYDPEQWDDIVKWAVDTGNTYIVHRRLSDSKIEELIKSGTPMPEGLYQEGYKKVSYRRK